MSGSATYLPGKPSEDTVPTRRTALAGIAAAALTVPLAGRGTALAAPSPPAML